jgi:hypothetical protein
MRMIYSIPVEAIMEALPIGMPKAQPLPEKHPLQAQQPEEQAVSSDDTVTINIPVVVSRQDLIPDPVTGMRPIDRFDFGFNPKGAVITSKEAIQSVVDDARNTPPAGKTLEYDESPGGRKISFTKGLIGYACSFLTPIATSLLMSGAAPMWAAPAAIIGGTVGIIAGLDGLKKAFDTRAYFMNKKAQGAEFDDIKFKNDNGETVTQRVSVDDMIKGSKDAIIGGGMHVLGSTLTAAAGLCGGPALAIGATVLMLGGALYGGRHAIASGAKKVGSFVKNMFTRNHAAEKNLEKPAADVQAAPQAVNEAQKAREGPALTPPSPSTQGA